MEMGSPAFSVESFTLIDEPDVHIFKTCSDIRVVSNSVVPAASLSVHYVAMDSGRFTGLFSVEELMEMKQLLLDKEQAFDLHTYLAARGVVIMDERDEVIMVH